MQGVGRTGVKEGHSTGSQEGKILGGGKRSGGNNSRGSGGHSTWGQEGMVLGTGWSEWHNTGGGQNGSVL